MNSLKNKTIVITGASRGIGRAIALKCAADGANIVIAAKSATPHPKLAGTIYSVAEEVEKAGGKALPVMVDVRYEESVEQMVAEAVAKFGGIDVLVNNAGAISLTDTATTQIKKLDLMFSVNVRAVFLCSQKALPHLKKSSNPHILNLSPPISLDPKWLKGHVAYTISKYGMSMCTLGMAAEFADSGIAVNSLWPKTMVDTAAVDMLFAGQGFKFSRKPDIMSDAVYQIITQEKCVLTGQTLIDEDVLRKSGVTDFEKYACEPGHELYKDLYVE